MPLNPYAPPIDDGAATPDAAGPHELARAAVLVARAWLALVVLGILLGFGAACWLGAEQWDPAPSGRIDDYGEVFALHAVAATMLVLAPALFCGIGNLLVPEAMGARKSGSVLLAAFAFLLWVPGAAVIVERTSSTPDDSFTMLAGAAPTAWLAPAFLTTALGLTALHYGAVVATGFRRATMLGRVVALGIVLPLVWQIVDIVERGGALATQPERGIVEMRFFFGASFTGSMHISLVATLALAIWILARRPRRSPAWLLVIGGVLPGLVAIAAARAWSAYGDAAEHLGDTLAVAGVFHLEVGTVVLAWLAGVFAWVEPLVGRTPRVWPARLGALAVCVGVLGHATTQIVLGSRGMPRRYLVYPEMLELQRTAMSFTALALVGSVLVIMSLVAPRRRDG